MLTISLKCAKRTFLRMNVVRFPHLLQHLHLFVSGLQIGASDLKTLQ